MLNSLHDIVYTAKQKGVKKLVVPCPGENDLSLLAEASVSGLIVPYFVGDEVTIKKMINGSQLAACEYLIEETDDTNQALNKALEILQNNAVDILMQGSLSAQTIVSAINDKHKGMVPKGSLLSFVSVFPLLKKEKLILVTDTFINNHPSIAEKQLILSNALKLARILGIETPKVAVLSAIEQVNPGIPSTLSAAALSKMSERHQFGDAIVEGPLDFDCALSQIAAERKGVKSVVTGNVDIYIVPEIDTGYLMAEALIFFGSMKMAGVVMGTKKPVILNLPFISQEERLIQIALACLLHEKGR